MGFWVWVVILAYALAGIGRVNVDVRSRGMHAPPYVRNRDYKFALIAAAIWPWRRGLIGIVLNFLFCLAVTALLLGGISLLLPLAWAVGALAALYGFFLVSNLAMLGG